MYSTMSGIIEVVWYLSLMLCVECLWGMCKCAYEGEGEHDG